MIGHEKSAHIALKAMKNDSTLKKAALASGDVDEATCDTVMDPSAMVGNGVCGA